MLSRRQFTSGCAGFVAAALCQSRFAHGEEQPLVERIDAAIGEAVSFLTARQGVDGAWRSEVYGPLKDGPSLTAFIAGSLAKTADKVSVQPALGNAVDYLASIDPYAAGISYPVYAAAGALEALCRQPSGRCAAARDAWLEFLRQQQLVETLGWREADDSFGGWSFAHEPPVPVDGKPHSPLAVPNLSATTFALDALRAAGCSENDGAVQKALVFVQRCQNWTDEESVRDARLDDGGFFFLHGDPIRNKPGEAGIDAAGRTRYFSYGSTTADGLRGLLACGLPVDHPRVCAARGWLTANFSADKHPGDYPPDREHLRPALYFYFAASVAEALVVSQPKQGCCNFGWAAALSKALLRRQDLDGPWANTAVDVREDDPLIATPLAVTALTACKVALGHGS